MNLLYIPIDYVGDDDKAVEFRDSLSERLLKANEAAASKGIRMGLKTTVNPGGVTSDGLHDFESGLQKLKKRGISTVLDAYVSGPAKSMEQVLFKPKDFDCNDATLIATGDLDQFLPDENLEILVDLAEHVHSDGALLGMGSRDRKVVLSSNPQNGYLRRIFEGYVNLGIKDTALANKMTITKNGMHPDPAYEAHGDMVTGVYVLNREHPRVEELDNCLSSMKKDNDYFGFEYEYSLALTAPRLGNLIVTPVRASPNPFPRIRPEDERRKILERQIDGTLIKMENTTPGQRLKSTIDKPGNTELLENFYTSGQVSEIRNRIRSNL